MVGVEVLKACCSGSAEGRRSQCPLPETLRSVETAPEIEIEIEIETAPEIETETEIEIETAPAPALCASPWRARQRAWG